MSERALRRAVLQQRERPSAADVKFVSSSARLRSRSVSARCLLAEHCCARSRLQRKSSSPRLRASRAVAARSPPEACQIGHAAARRPGVSLTAFRSCRNGRRPAPRADAASTKLRALRRRRGVHRPGRWRRWRRMNECGSCGPITAVSRGRQKSDMMAGSRCSLHLVPIGISRRGTSVATS